MSLDPVFMPVRELAEHVRARRLSPVALAETFLARLEKIGPRYNAVVTVTRERAMAAARQVPRISSPPEAASRPRGARRHSASSVSPRMPP